MSDDYGTFVPPPDQPTLDVVSADRLLTRKQDMAIRAMITMAGWDPAGKEMLALQEHVGIGTGVEPWAWRLATRRQADRMIGVLVNYTREMRRG